MESIWLESFLSIPGYPIVAVEVHLYPSQACQIYLAQTPLSYSGVSLVADHHKYKTCVRYGYIEA